MKEKLLTIIRYYGIKKQLKYFQSEVFELNEAVINKLDRDEFNPFVGLIRVVNKVTGKETKDEYVEHIAEEIADVLVMLEQIRLNYNIPTSDIKKIMEYKTDRQIERIKKELEESKSE